jgi:outer membrane murein-binding lipoprotein Lpp
MKKKIFILFIIFVVLLSGCSNESQSIKSENEQLIIKISQLEKELSDKNSKISELQNSQNNAIKNIMINYIENRSSKMFVEKKCDLLALPIENTIKLNPIDENTVVNVLDTAEVNNAIWLYVSIPVYDTPSNYKGWIKETNSVLYTKEIMNKVQGDVKVTEGEDVYETSNFEDIKIVIPYKANKERGRIVEKKNGYVRINCPGGKTIWVKDTSIIYPDVD